MNDLYRKYFLDMPCYLTVQDRNLRIVDANRQFAEDFGSWEGRYCYQVYKHRDDKCEDCPVEQTFRDGKSHNSLERVTSLDGKETSVIVYTTPIKDESGEITGVMEMSTDITDVMHRSSQFQMGQQRYRQIFEEVPCYISIQDRDFNIVDVNRRFKDDFGSYLGCKCYEVYKHRNEICIPCPVQQTFDDGKIHSSEEVVTSIDGEQMHVLVYTSPIPDSRGMISRVMEMSTDITPIRNLQSQLESIGLLIGSVSHGIKGLLNGLDGGMYLVNTGMKKGDQERIQKGWEMVERNVNRIRSQVLNILYYTKEREPGYETISVMDLAADVCKNCEAKAVELQVKFECDLDKKAGDFEIDQAAMRSLLVNLLENALDACRVDKKKTEHLVTFRMTGHADHVLFEISDNGIGMDQETREKAFSLFFSSKGAKGTGLGLFISNNIIKAHGGRIEFESKLDHGTRFEIMVPRARVESELEETAN
ncbi:MAG: PAS domain-containing sensor histidine kinase [Proteobacteria bacterium]|nr:PAS domain-containing sensor histidine kinase [Pseudomonadota bacterium]